MTAPKSTARTILEHTGIPSSWLKKPKLPSRNWLIFLTVTSTITGYYAYDRRECKRIRQEYIDKVKYLSEESIQDPLAVPRRIRVYAAKWPGDEDYDIAMRYFRKYLKPYLAAAAIDYDMIRGARHGDIATQVAEEIRLRRRLDAGIDQPTPHDLALPTYTPPEVKHQRELEGGIVIVGRPTWKEFMAGSIIGWRNSDDALDKVDEDSVLGREFESDGHFDEVEGDAPLTTGTTVHPLSAALGSGVFSSMQRTSLNLDEERQNQLPSNAAAATIPRTDTIPPLPPLLLVKYTNFVGFRQIPVMLWGFFNQREKVRSGAEAAYTLIFGHTREFVPPSLDSIESSSPFIQNVDGDDDNDNDNGKDTQTTDNILSKPQGGDLDFAKSSESYYRTWLSTTVSDIQKAREKFYVNLPPKLSTARSLDRRTREPTNDEMKYPPPTEFDLREERVKKEKRWRSDLVGIEIIRPEREVRWDSRLGGAFRVFDSPNKKE